MKLLFKGNAIKDMLTQVSNTASEKQGITLSFSEQSNLGTVMQVTAYNGTNMQVSTYVPCTLEEGSENGFEETTKYVGVGFLNSIGGLLAFEQNIRMEIMPTEVILSLQDRSSTVKVPLKEEGVTVDYDAGANSICAISVNTKEFCSALKKYGFAASNIAPGCDGIFAKSVEDGLMLASVDGCAGASGCIDCNVLVPLQEKEELNGFLFPQKIATICNNFSQEETQIFFLKPYALLVNGMTFVMVSRPSAVFQEAMINFVMQNKHIACEVELERSSLANVLMLLKNTEKGSGVSIKLFVEDDKLCLSNASGETVSYIKIRKSGELEDVVHISMVYLEKICAIVPDKLTIRFQCKCDGKPLPIMFSLDDEYEAFTLPVIPLNKSSEEEATETE